MFDISKWSLQSALPNSVYTTPNGPPVVPIWLPPDFFLWGMLKARVYEKNPPDLSALKSRIKREIAKVTRAQLSDVLKIWKNACKCVEAKMANIFNIWCNQINIDFITLFCCFFLENSFTYNLSAKI